MSITFCPRCGAPFPVEVLGELIRTNVRCSDCRLAPTEPPAVLPPSEDGEGELGYELTDWPVTDRGAVTSALAESGTPYRWEDGLVLVVAAESEAEVDALLDEIEEQGGAGEALEGDDEDGVPGPDGGEEAAQAMSDLFLSVDRLQHAPFDAAAAGDLRKAAEVVAGCLPPYGVEPAAWQRIRELAAGVLTGVDEEAEDEEVADQARALRDFLREYV